MGKKPSLKVVGDSPGNSPQPPRKLGAPGRQLWDRVHREFDIADSGGIELLTLACEATDRAQELSEAITRNGVTVKTRTGIKAHPALRDEIQCRALVARLLKQLGITLEPLRTYVGGWGV